MEIFHTIEKNNILKEIGKGAVLALGFFDGLHIGHKKIIETAIKTAEQNNTKSVVITFSRNPADYFSSETTLNIQTFKDRELLLEAYGLDCLFELDFSEFKEMSALDYIKNVLVENFSPSTIVVGYNHTFGKDKSGNALFLKEEAQKFGYECIIVPEQKFEDKEKVSSSIIRKEIEYGNLETLKKFLGRYFSIRNSVIRGQRLARTFSLPTANIIWPNSLVKLPYGVYFGFCQLDNRTLPSLIFWGTKPTLTDGKEETLEAHIYNFNENLYGKIIKVAFCEKLREQENFHNVLVLKTQLQKDYKKFEAWAKLKS